LLKMPVLNTFSALSSRGYGGSGGLKSLIVNYLLIGGGGGGAAADPGNSDSEGPGGAGGYLSGTNLVLTSANNIVITIGAGGVQGINATKGENSVLNYGIGLFTAFGGGASPNKDGGSGAGAKWDSVVGVGVVGQGKNGANGPNDLQVGGGGGAGTDGSLGSAGGAGGAGLTWSIGSGGDNITRAGGGGGHSTTTGGTGGAGGGGRGASSTLTAGAGTANTGGGGGAGFLTTNNAGGDGGSGVCIISYPGTVAKASGGIITTANSLVYHTFNSSGVFTIL
jgi:hypothetical protein